MNPVSINNVNVATWHPADRIDGSFGTNRAAGARRQITANTDSDAIKAWLINYVETKTTFDNYRKEAERLMLWATIELGKPVSSLTHEDLVQYRHFLANPHPADRWIMTRKVGRAHPGWRPFAKPLQPSSQKQAITILDSMFTWLVDAGYLAGNPLALSRKRSKRQQAVIVRYLDEDVWREVRRTIDLMESEKERDREHAFRIRWLFALAYLCGLRISEIVNNTMGCFHSRRDKQGEHRWWISITGKGNITREIPATDELMIELARYRREKGLAPYPLTGETTPLLLPVGKRTTAMTRGAIHGLVKKVFEDTASRMRIKNGRDCPLAAHVELASAHWLRHTAASHMANNAVDLLHVRDNLGHASISTTNQYLHSSDDARHTDTEGKHRLDW